MSTFGSAQYATTLDRDLPEALAPAATLKVQVAERLAAHRDRTRHRTVPRPAPPAKPAAERAARIAAAVAERYANSQTYRAFLAAEAERAVQQAAAEAEAAARHAEEIEVEQRRLLADLEAESQAKLDAAAQPALCAETAPPTELPAPKLSKPARQSVAPRTAKAARPGAAVEVEQVQPIPGSQAGGLTIRLFESSEPNRSFPPRALAVAQPSLRPATSADNAADLAEALALDEEIAFRHDPVFEEAPEPAMPLPANLIEFPRQLVAARKARPRHAEGPLLADAGEEPGLTQLRIFEVEPAQISPAPPVEDAAPEWSSIWLDAIPPDTSAFPVESPTRQLEGAALTEGGPVTLEGTVNSGHQSGRLPHPHTAAIPRRLLAATIDGGFVVGAFLAFAAGFSFITGASAGTGFAPIWILSQIASQIGVAASWIAAAVALGFLYVAYHLLFCSLTESTPGMRCARIALCTFSDDSPTRAAMRRRVAAVLLSACPLGLGFIWAIIDEDRLGWHDRITGIYPRKY